eukprot:3048609-Karenia_brevis.AAC.1
MSANKDLCKQISTQEEHLFTLLDEIHAVKTEKQAGTKVDSVHVAADAGDDGPLHVGDRAAFASRIFKQLDRDRDGYLDIAELKRFAVLTGFEGDSFAWAEEYKQMC